METRRDERISQLIQALKRSDKLHLKEAAALLGVSEMTIRRDLNGHNGPVVLLGGYIVLEPRSATHYLLSDQKTRLVDEKRRAARHAAALLEAHQMAFFDCGTTTPWIIDAIDNALPFTGICYSLNTFWRCRKNRSVGPFSAAASSMPAMPFLNRSACRIPSAICARTSPSTRRPGSTARRAPPAITSRNCRLNTGR
jgi:DeoR family deoxyribose operon repressor